MTDPVRFLQAQPGWRVASLDTARSFYRGLGFVPVFEVGAARLVMARDAVTIHLSTTEGHPGGCQIMVDDVDALYRELDTRDLRVLHEPGDRDWGCRDFTIEDPDGNEITFSQVLGHAS